MLPRDLKPEQFAGYPPEARKLVANNLATLQQLPLSFVPSLLRELIDYDFKFPAERKAREKELANLSSLSAAQIKELFQGFAQIRLSPELEEFDWAKSPAQFVEQLSAHLWSTHQLDAFRKASNDYADHLRSAVPPDPPAIPRLGITVIGQGWLRTTSLCFENCAPMERISAASSRKMGCDGCWMRLQRGPKRIPLPTPTGTSMAVKRLSTRRRSPASRTKLWNQCAPRCCARCSRRSNDPAWDPKRCARFWLRCVPPISAWTG